MAVPNLRDLEQRWDDGASRDAMYVILSLPEKKGRRWDVDAFFESGRAEIHHVLEHARGLGFPRRRGRALDFGCGIGRITQALAAHFEQVDGVDISASMIDQARALNRSGVRCRYHHNPAPDLALLADDSFDLVYSNIVLQHIAPELTRTYIHELVRVLAPDGLLLFQLPSEPASTAAPGPASASSQPLDPAACAAALSPPVAAIRGGPGTTVELRVAVTNLGAHTWPARGAPDGTGEVRLGNHWLASDGAVLQFDDTRASLPCDVAPRERVDIPLTVTLPDQPGAYVLELDLVQETVDWFAARGSQAARVPVTVAGEGSPVDGDGSFSVWQPTCLEVHAIPKAAVLDVLTSAGAQVLDVVGDGCAGPAWIGYRYAATKAPA